MNFKITKDMSKQEEIDAITRLAEEAVEPGTYLADLFTKEMVTWVCANIRDDFPPELFQHYMQQCDENRNTSMKFEKEIEHQKALLSAIEAEKESLALALKLKCERVDALLKQEEQWATLYHQTCEERNTAQDKLKEAQEMIRALKVEVYDLTH